ncbi:hypothetical protein RJT34_26427 [Clitoria ternatea]|uniref:Glycosyltransferase n=1 Tax=Clitoria ternatea TaxID=43366 RepID=A0AAN9IBJ9_CLITE
MEEAVVFYPAPLISHLFSTIELCKLIIKQKPSLSINVLTTTAPYDTSSTSDFISTASTTLPSITFHSLPTLTLPHTLLSSTPIPETLLFHVLHHNHPHVHQTLLSISKAHKIQALVLDIFCAQSISIASQLNLPAFIFFTSGASTVASFLYHPTIHETYDKSFKELNTFLRIPGVPPIPSCDMPKCLHERNDETYKNLLECSVDARKASGFIVNTFEALEPRCIKAISSGLCIPNSPTPPLYCLGPMITNTEEKPCDEECLRWLDKQPSKSVVLLCFGSLGAFSKEQLCEIAIGLERSGQRFLWVVRNPVSDGKENKPSLGLKEDPDMDSLLPEGFLGRTKEMGLVVKNWAPQEAVLKHDSVGGFVSHCGWNSVLEAVSGGVPMVAWPLYAEQRFNRVVLVEDMEIALWMHESVSGFVTAIEVEERVKELMESENGKRVRKRVMIVKCEAEAALREGGSSCLALAKLLQSWKGPA